MCLLPDRDSGIDDPSAPRDSILLPARASGVSTAASRVARKWFSTVKEGEHRVSVLDAQLLPMLAEDNDCIKNLKELCFAMVEITPEHAAHVARLVNVRSIHFYDTRGADFVLEYSRNLPIEELSFDSTPLSHDFLRILTELPCLKKLYFGYELGPHELVILQALPPGVAVETGEFR